MRTYGSRSSRPPVASSPQSSLSSSPAQAECLGKRRRPLDEQPSFKNLPPPKRTKTSSPYPRKSDKKQKQKQQTLRQLHFSIDTTVLRTCPLCDLSYTKGVPDDESLHRTHCARVQKGMEWGREEDKETIKAGVTEIANRVRLKDGRRGRIICFKADVGGKIGLKLSTLLETINLALSAPALPPSILQASKAYLFLLPPVSPISCREKIAGCVIAQRISTAMAIASPAECISAYKPESPPTASPLSQPPSDTSTSTPTTSLIPVDTSTGIFCDPTPLPTPLGIPRLFVPSTHRRQGIATQLLQAAAETFIYGCPLDPKKGQVAFSQPTGDGTAVMSRWGAGAIRIYED